jgi:sulfate transport system substrate-binding protein
MVSPRSTILIENPAALIDASVDKHHTREPAAALVAFLRSKPAQEVFARHGLRSVDAEVAAAHAEQYPPVQDLFTVEFFGGWKAAVPAVFGENGVYSVAIGELQK